ncbi:ComEC/Rec2 family competence protein [Cellulophaga sp. Hel_I_12]|uniref:ComEC/Rec2 family competence protein n=1 Tax=Cellulophaga sp. Hel_I_12 TaxID=1249972 RepID=UPI0006465641|nr:ComEC/Rec2 family competence protein [Cellulophaga sp. Hel_I_12]
MQLLKFVPIKLTLFLVAGILTGYYFNFSILFPFISVLLLIIILGFLFKIKKRTSSALFGVIALLSTFCIGLFAVSMANPKNYKTHYSNFNGNEVQAIQLKIVEVLKPNSFSARYIAETQAIGKQVASGKLLLSIAKDSTKAVLQIDEEILVYNSIKAVNSPLNPHQFNYKKYLKDLGILGQLHVKEADYIKKTNPSKTVYGLAAHIRERIIRSLKTENFGTEELAIIQALLLGQRNDISEDTYDAYKDAGAVHILAVSGLHVGILLLILQFLLQPVKSLAFGQNIKLVLVVVFLWAFAFIAGLSASVVRAVTMFSFLAYALYLNRPSNKFNILALSLFFILLIKPMYLFQVGFQMSYAAVFAILWIYPRLQRFWFPKQFLIRKIWQLMSVSIAAQLGVLPISLFYFHQFPSLFFISNVVIVPCLGIILSGGLLVIILSVLQILPDFVTYLYNEIIQTMNAIVYWVAQQESFVFKTISFDGIQLVLTYILIFLLVTYFNKPAFKKMMFFLGSIIALQTWSFIQVYTTHKKEHLMVLHQTKYTGILAQNGAALKLWTNHPKNFETIIQNYSLNERIVNFSVDSLQNNYQFKTRSLYLFDSLAIFPPKDFSYDIVVLTQSPNINLDRLIEALKPTLIIADGSNYKSDVVRWQATCAKTKLPFHYTGDKGAYDVSLSERKH